MPEPTKVLYHPHSHEAGWPEPVEAEVVARDMLPGRYVLKLPDGNTVQHVVESFASEPGTFSRPDAPSAWWPLVADTPDPETPVRDED